MAYNPNQGQILFSAAEVLRIRQDHVAGTLSVRAWADLKECSLETVRKIVRHETYRHVRTAEDSTRRGLPARVDGVGERVLVSAPARQVGLEPSEEEMAGSFARLQAALAAKADTTAENLLGAIADGKAGYAG